MINVGILAKIRRMHFRDGMSLREVAKRTGLSRNTIRRWLRQPDVTEPIYPPRKSPSKVDAWAELLVTWLKTGSHRVKRERRTATALFEALRAQGYDGGYGRVCAFIRRWKQEQNDSPKRAAYVPLAFALGEAFQFNWSCEYVFVGGLRRRQGRARQGTHDQCPLPRQVRSLPVRAGVLQSSGRVGERHRREFAATR